MFYFNFGKTGCRLCNWLMISSIVIGCWLVSTTATVAQLVDPPKVVSQELVKKLLTEFWRRTPENDSLAKKTYADQPNAGPDVQLAYLLNRINHNKNREALAVAQKLNTKHPDSIDGWLLRAWLDVLVDNFDRSLVDIRAVQKRLETSERYTESQTSTVYHRLGQWIGYLQGPVGHKQNDELLESTLRSIVNGASRADAARFNQSREKVLEQFDQLQDSQRAKFNREFRKQAVQDSNQIKLLQNQNASFEQQLAGLLEQQERLRQEGLQQIANLTQLLSPLESRLASISSQIRSVQFDLQLLYTDLFHSHNVDHDHDVHPLHRHSTHLVSGQIRSLELALYQLRAEGNAVSNRIQAIQNQIGQSKAAYSNQIAGIQRQRNKLSVTIRRNQIKLNKLLAGPQVADGKKGALENRLVSLTSYVEFPIELYRQQMLDMLQVP